MILDFDLEHVETTEFGVGRDDIVPSFYAVPANAEVQSALLEMVSTTILVIGVLENEGGAPKAYSPAEKHAALEYLVVPAESEFETTLRSLHEAANLPRGPAVLTEPDDVISYFARFTDHAGRHLTAVRRAAQFKGVLQRRLLRIVDDSLQIVEDDVFKLDRDFDVLVDASGTHIMRPSAFEFLGNLKDAILEAVAENVNAIGDALPFVDFGGIERYAARRPRAARYLASIRAQTLAGMDQRALTDLCRSTGVDVQDVNGRLVVGRGYEMGFLQVLDRRRYALELVHDEPERFVASSRDRIGGG